MVIERPSSARGRGGDGPLDSRHAFSFGGYYDPAWMGFGPLRVVNEDRIAPGAGYPMQRRANMEILTCVLAGEFDPGIASPAPAAPAGVVPAGGLHWLGAGHGIECGGSNARDDRALHVLQLWIQPDRLNAPPTQGRQAPVGAGARGRWALLASPDGAGGSIAIRQDARVFVSQLEPGVQVAHVLDPPRRYWLQVTGGTVQAAGRQLHAGDAIALAEEAGELVVQASAVSGVLLLDLP